MSQNTSPAGWPILSNSNSSDSMEFFGFDGMTSLGVHLAGHALNSALFSTRRTPAKTFSCCYFLAVMSTPLAKSTRDPCGPSPSAVQRGDHELQYDERKLFRSSADLS